MKTLNYCGLELKSGDKVKGTIQNQKVEGIIEIENNKLFFCQDLKKGLGCVNKHGYKYGWVFNSGYTISDNVRITNLNGIDVNLTLLLYKNNGLYLLKKDKETYLFKIQNHPDCCGCTLFYNFCRSETLM